MRNFILQHLSDLILTKSEKGLSIKGYIALFIFVILVLSAPFFGALLFGFVFGVIANLASRADAIAWIIWGFFVGFFWGVFSFWMIKFYPDDVLKKLKDSGALSGTKGGAVNSFDDDDDFAWRSNSRNNMYSRPWMSRSVFGTHKDR